MRVAQVAQVARSVREQPTDGGELGLVVADRAP
jgi:hypothetical protein